MAIDEAGRAFWAGKSAGRAVVGAILAFLRHDRERLMAARKRLLAVPGAAQLHSVSEGFPQDDGAGR
jgi:hypothetical protein